MSGFPVLDAIRARAEAATEGPFGVRQGVVYIPAPFDLHRFDAMDETVAVFKLRDEDAEFFVASRTDVPLLTGVVDAVLALHEEVPLTASAAYCGHCGDLYPCPTVRAIKEGLG